MGSGGWYSSVCYKHAAMNVPILTTERLILRGQRMEDFPSYAAMWATENVTRFIGGKPQTEEEAWARFLRIAGQWQMLGYGFWTIEVKAGGKRIGEAGFVEGRREIEPSLKGMPEIGWGIHPEEQGKGYALEAATAALNWGIEHFKGQPIRCIIAPENTPSLKLAEKLGFRELVRTVYKGEPIIMLERR